jgi:hypothetical protein
VVGVQLGQTATPVEPSADTSSGMDDAFSMVAARVPRNRRLTPFTTRLVVVGVAVALTIGIFGIYVAGQQRAADARRASLLASQRAALQAEAAAVEIGGEPVAADGSAVVDLLNSQARAAATAALDAARRAAASDGLDEATAARLATLEPDLLFVDGPSTAPSVVSVYAGPAGWAAAVQGGKDVCYWVARTATGRERFGTGTACTGPAALAADAPSW